MCGIAGIIPTTTSGKIGPDDQRMLQNALTAMHHRGPDDSQIRRAGNVLLGHNRLSILDLSEKASQPMANETGRYMIAFNGEIFNYCELREDLKQQGITFNSDSDTEVLLQLLILEGERCLDKLNGFFAFVLVDTETGSGLLVRDRYGEKPLWYNISDERLVFASELKGLKKLGIPQTIDTTSLALLLQLSYIPAPQSIYSGVSKLMPGELIRFGDGRITKEKWYNIRSESPVTDIKQAGDQLSEILEDAVRIRLRSDVPVGCFLSGGVDSSIVAYLAKKNKSDLQTFSIGFPDVPFLDESNYAKEVAVALGTQHRTIDVTAQMMIDEAENISDKLDEPFADSSAIAAYILAKTTRQYVKVALSGDGADELFAGYNKHSALEQSMKGSAMNTLLKWSAPLFRHLPKGRTGKISNLIRQISRYSQGLNLSLKDRYVLWSSFSDPNIAKRLVKNCDRAGMANRLNTYLELPDEPDFNSLLLADQKLVLANDMLTKVDVTAMACSLEVRPPFLDYRVVEFANRLDSKLKILDGKRKIILKEAFGKFLPESVFNRRKQGFEVPLERWLQTNLKPLVIAHLGSPRCAGFEYLDYHEVERILHAFYNRQKLEHASLIYSMLMFAMWLERQKD